MRATALTLSGLQALLCSALLVAVVIVTIPGNENPPFLLLLLAAPYILLLLLALLPLILAIRGRAKRTALVLSLLAFGLLLFYLAVQFGLVFEAPPVQVVT